MELGGEAAALEVFKARRFRWARVTCRVSSGRSTPANEGIRLTNYTVDAPSGGAEFSIP
jgi:hypothetical protein